MGNNDDFLVPTDVDLYTSCDIDLAVVHKGTILRSCAILSIAAYAYLFWMYFIVKTPVLKRHPTRLAIYGCIIEMGYFQQYLWLPTVGKDYLYSDDAITAPFYCNSSLAASRWALVTQFCQIGVQMCFLIISVDLRLAYTNPFSSYKHNKYYFGVVVIGFSLLTALCLLAMGPRVYGYDEHGIIWIQDSRASLAMNWPKFMLYYLIVTCIYTYSLWANFQFYRSSEKGLSVTISNRLSIMLRSKRFVVGHIFFDTLILALEFLSFLNNSNSQLLLSIPSYLQALRGVLGFIVIMYSNWQDLTWQSLNPFYFASSVKDKNMVERVALEGLMQQPHLNTALRAEILYFSTQGIMFAARSFGGAGADDPERNTDEESGRSGGDSSANHAGGNSVDHGSDVYGFDSHPTLGIRPSLVDESMRAGAHVPSGLPPRGPIKPIGATTAGGTRTSNLETNDLSRFHKAQDEATNGAREQAFMDEVEYLGLARGSVSFKGVDGRHNSSSSAVSPYNFLAANTAYNASQFGGSASIRASLSNVSAKTAVDTRNPMMSVSAASAGATGRSSGAAAADRSRNSGSGWLRGSELEMRSTKDTTTRQSEDSHVTTGSDVTVKWKDTTDVEFSMGRADNGNQSAPDAWYRVPSAGNKAKKSAVHYDENASVSDSDASGRSNSSTAVEKVRRTLQNALSNAQSMFNPAYREFRFKDFSPGLFAKVRDMCNITPDDYARSFEATCKETFSEGRSGAFMFFSSDQKCIAKSTPKGELLSLTKLMPKYVEYLMSNPNSLITRFLGAHCITMYGVELHFVVMLNCLPSQRLSERYDLKGSWVNRHGLTKTTAGNGKKRDMSNKSFLYLDNDLQHKLSLQPGVAHLIADQIFKDVEFLTLHKKMDYSLLVGVKKERFEVMANHNESDKLLGARDSMATISAPNGRITDHALSRSASMFSSPTVTSFVRTNDSHSTPSSKAKSDTTTSMRVMSHGDDDSIDDDEDGGLHTRFVEGPAKYYLGIIDVLQEWTLSKQLERFIKVYIYRWDGDGISAMNPQDYCKRFLRRCVIETFEGLDEQNNPSFVSGNTADNSTRSATAFHGSRVETY